MARLDLMAGRHTAYVVFLKACRCLLNAVLKKNVANCKVTRIPSSGTTLARVLVDRTVDVFALVVCEKAELAQRFFFHLSQTQQVCVLAADATSALASGQAADSTRGTNSILQHC